MKMVKLSEIRIDGGTQYRDQINQDVVRDYAEKMRDGEEFPALDTVFDGATHWLVDGFHRYFASHDVGFKDVKVNYKPGTQEEAQLLALGVNAGHDLNQDNLPAFAQAVPGLLEVSIGHALIADALEVGYAATVRGYLKAFFRAFSLKIPRKIPIFRLTHKAEALRHHSSKRVGFGPFSFG